MGCFKELRFHSWGVPFSLPQLSTLLKLGDDSTISFIVLRYLTKVVRGLISTLYFLAACPLSTMHFQADLSSLWRHAAGNAF